MNIILIAVLMIILLIIAWLLFSGRNEEVITRPAELKLPEETEPEKILRRRASDRAIEQEFPEEPAPGAVTPERFREMDQSGVFELPYSANEIIPDNSRFKLYKRTLVNSEIYAIKGDYETAISLFKGVKDRISDYDVRSKIESNIDYLNHFRKRREDDVKKKVESLYSSQQGGELRLKIDGPVPQTINIGLPEKSINADDIIEKISQQISNQLLNVKDEFERLKAETEEKMSGDDSHEFEKLHEELNSLKEKFAELDRDKNRTLEELNKLRETREEELKFYSEQERLRQQEDLLNQIKDEMRGFSDLKSTLDKLNEKIEDLTSLKIPESSREPQIIHAKYEAPIPVHFDPEPVLEILDRISRQHEKNREEEKKAAEAAAMDTGIISEPVEAEAIDDVPEGIIEEIIPEPEIPEEEELSEAHIEEELPETPSEEDIPVFEPEKDEIPIEEKTFEKEKEIEKHIDAEEDANEFELLSEYGQTKDDSTLTDEDIFEKILQDDNKKDDDAAFEIIGDFHKDETEYSFDDTEMDEKKKAEHDFYKKFIKPDRVKKKELPILKVSYDFKKLPDEFSLSREKNILEYSFYKYKPMLTRADEFIKQRRVKDAINYYRVVLDQNIPVEFKIMIKRNINDLTEYLEKYLGAE